MENLKQQLGEMIHRDWNHPSIIIWGLGDDLSEYHYSEDFVELSDAAHKLDPSRWTAARSPHVTDVTDATSEPNLVEAHRLHPESKYIWNEWGSFASQPRTDGTANRACLQQLRRSRADSQWAQPWHWTAGNAARGVA